MVKAFTGSVSAQANPGETVTITLTAPNGAVTLATTITDKNGNFTVNLYFPVQGNYTYTLSMQQDPKYVAPTPKKGTFTVP